MLPCFHLYTSLPSEAALRGMTSVVRQCVGEEPCGMLSSGCQSNYAIFTLSRTTVVATSAVGRWLRGTDIWCVGISKERREEMRGSEGDKERMSKKMGRWAVA